MQLLGYIVIYCPHMEEYDWIISVWGIFKQIMTSYWGHKGFIAAWGQDLTSWGMKDLILIWPWEKVAINPCIAKTSMLLYIFYTKCYVIPLKIASIHIFQLLLRAVMYVIQPGVIIGINNQLRNTSNYLFMQRYLND